MKYEPPNLTDRKGVVALSGGMDSTTLLHACIEAGAHMGAVLFDYGQRHSTELVFAHRTATRLHVPAHVIDLKSFGSIAASALTTAGAKVPEGHYADESMKQTVVPCRNAMFLAATFAAAASSGADFVAIGPNACDHTIYPDCRPEFFSAMEHALNLGLNGITAIQIMRPFVRLTKTDIVTLGTELGVRWMDTWSCYNGRAKHCGKCGTCVERIEAFSLAGLTDPTEYE